jgi:CheY-like chemotaxis protein
VVEAMGGQIGLQSSPGAGSCFWFTLPVTNGAKPISLRPIALARRALVVDASRSAREVLKSQIERWQIDCDATGSAYDAFARLEAEARSAQPFDVVVMAERTSDLSGPELLRAIGAHPAARQVPIVLLTYKGSALGAAEIDSVASAQLTKPASPAALHRCITNVVERRMVSMPAARRSPEPRRSGRPEAPRALVVDDNEINQFAVVELLTELGFAPDVARNGREAVEMTARHKYAIVFMDCEMPEMDGYEATREIRRSLHAGSHVPIIALTAHNGPEERSKGLAAGMNEYMAKPVRQDALEATIVRWTSTAPEAPSAPNPRLPKPPRPAMADAETDDDSAIASTESEPP